MNKIKFKIKIPNKFVNLNNYFIDQFNKLKKLKFKKIKNLTLFFLAIFFIFLDILKRFLVVIFFNLS